MKESIHRGAGFSIDKIEDILEDADYTVESLEDPLLFVLFVLPIGYSATRRRIFLMALASSCLMRSALIP